MDSVRWLFGWTKPPGTDAPEPVQERAIRNVFPDIAKYLPAKDAISLAATSKSLLQSIPASEVDIMKTRAVSIVNKKYIRARSLELLKNNNVPLSDLGYAPVDKRMYDLSSPHPSIASMKLVLYPKRYRSHRDLPITRLARLYITFPGDTALAKRGFELVKKKNQGKYYLAIGDLDVWPYVDENMQELSSARSEAISELWDVALQRVPLHVKQDLVMLLLGLIIYGVFEVLKQDGWTRRNVVFYDNVHFTPCFTKLELLKKMWNPAFKHRFVTWYATGDGTYSKNDPVRRQDPLGDLYQQARLRQTARDMRSAIERRTIVICARR